MEVCFISNFLNHHIVTLVESVLERGDECWFVSTIGEVPTDAINLGYASKFDCDSRVLYPHRDKAKVLDVIAKSDIVVSAYYGVDLIQERVDAGKLTFISAERIFKSNNALITGRIKNALRRVKYLWINKRHHYDKNCYFMPKGAYAASDFSKCGIKKDRMLRGAYFPDVSHFTEPKQYRDKLTRFAWVGRFWGWKHPDDAIRVIKRLHDENYNVELFMIGHEGIEEQLHEMAKGLDYVHFTGALPFMKVREQLFQTDAYLFTSDYQEGWGCVLNEAMAEGCAVVASKKAGATTYLINDGENGLVYDGSVDDLYEKTLSLLKSPERIQKMGQAAKYTIEHVWNADVTVENLVQQYESIIQHGRFSEKVTGPCSIITR